MQEPPASPKPKRTSRKKKEAAAPEETVTEEVPAETTESVDTADSILDTEEPAVEPDVPVVEEAAAPGPHSFSCPGASPGPQRSEAPVLTIRSRDDVETAEDRDNVIWHEIHNAYRTRKIITGKLGGIEQLDNRKTVAVVDYNGVPCHYPYQGNDDQSGPQPFRSGIRRPYAAPK